MLPPRQEVIEVTQMSATATPSDAEELSKEDRLKAFLREKAADGEVYFKSKFIADEVGLSPKEIGALMVKLKDSATELEVEKWSYTSATTWRIEPA
jgi:hypothetical protein